MCENSEIINRGIGQSSKKLSTQDNNEPLQINLSKKQASSRMFLFQELLQMDMPKSKYNGQITLIRLELKANYKIQI